MFKARKKIQRIFGFATWLLATCLHAQTWQQITPGIEYLDLNSNALTQWSHIHVFRIDLHQNRFEIIMAKDLPQHYASAQAFKQHSHALIAINGGFFNPNKDPLGLRISRHQLLNPLKSISWWGVFSIAGEQATITAPYNFHPDAGVDFAIQTGPRLLISGKIPLLKPGFANRSALGIDNRGQVVMVVTENMPMTTTELAQTLKNPPLHCVDALNLDGGSSSQLYAKTSDFHLDVPGFSQVSDAIIVKSKR